MADCRTPLSVLMHGEDHEQVTACRAIDAAVGRIVGRMEDELGSAMMEMGLSRGDWEDLVRDAIDAEIHQTRLNTVRGMLRYFWDGGLNPWQAMKRLLGATREAANELIGGVSQTEVAMILGETKAATSAREKKLEDLLKRWGVRGYRLAGGTKSDESREVYRKLRKGNKSRAKGEWRKRAERLRQGEGKALGSRI